VQRHLPRGKNAVQNSDGYFNPKFIDVIFLEEKTLRKSSNKIEFISQFSTAYYIS
jgi:hypothetical protein